MRILMVHDNGWSNKGPHQHHHLLEKLSAKGHHVVVIEYDHLWRTRNEPTSSPRIAAERVRTGVHQFYDNANVTCVSPPFIKMPLLDYLSLAATFRRQIKQEIQRARPDVIVGFTGVISPFWGAALAEEMHIPYVDYWLDATDQLVPEAFLRPLARTIQRSTVKKASLVLTLNETLREYVIELGANPSTTQVLPGGVDLRRFDPAATDSQLMRDKYSLGKDDLVLFFMGWLYDFAGLQEAVREIARLRDVRPDLKLLIVGEGDFYPRLQEIVRENHMQDSVVFTGRVPYTEIPELIAAADIALLPAHDNEIMRNAVPIKIYEYLAMRKPTICTKLSGIMREFGRDCGILYIENPEDAVGVAANLTQEDVQILKMQAKQFIENYDWDKITDRFEETLSSLVEANHPGASSSTKHSETSFSAGEIGGKYI
jgi:glycosyltransferase involved in cell wall biosynthesis